MKRFPVKDKPDAVFALSRTPETAISSSGRLFFTLLLGLGAVLYVSSEFKNAVEELKAARCPLDDWANEEARIYQRSAYSAISPQPQRHSTTKEPKYIAETLYPDSASTAICITGEARTFNTSEVFDSMRAHLIENPSLPNAKVFVVLPESDLQEASVTERLDQLAAQDVHGTRTNDSDFLTFSKDRACLNLPSRTLWQAFRAAKCLTMVQSYEQTNDMRFDRFIRMRPDLFFRAPTDFRKLHKLGSWTHLPFWGDRSNPHVGMNDIFVVSSRNTAQALYSMQTHWPCPLSREHIYDMEIMWSSKIEGGEDTHEWYMKHSIARAHEFDGSPYWAVTDMGCWIHRPADFQP